MKKTKNEELLEKQLEQEKSRRLEVEKELENANKLLKIQGVWKLQEKIEALEKELQELQSVLKEMGEFIISIIRRPEFVDRKLEEKTRQKEKEIAEQALTKYKTITKKEKR